MKDLKNLFTKSEILNNNFHKKEFLQQIIKFIVSDKEKSFSSDSFKTNDELYDFFSLIYNTVMM